MGRLILAALFACSLAHAAPPPVTLRLVAAGLAQPLGVTSAGDGSGRLFVLEKAGVVKVIRNGAVLPTPFLDIRSQVATTGERGLLGLAFHPAFATNRRFYVFYTMLPDAAGGGALRVSTFLASAANPDVADPASEREVVTVPHGPFSNHNGGSLAFGPDGLLYIGMGDGGGLDPDNNGQNPVAGLGKIHRIDVDSPGAPLEMYAYGVRNPWRFSFDRARGDFYLGDVGQSAIEEIDFLPAGTAPGTNFGWKVFEGTECFSPSSGCALANHRPPILQYRHDAEGGNSVTGGHVYRGWTSAALHGYYFYGDFVSNRVWAAIRKPGGWETSVVIAPGNGLLGVSSFGEGEEGELYVVSLINGRVYAIEAPGPEPLRTRIDFNRDARTDIVWQHADGRTALWLMQGARQGGGTGLIGAGTGWSVRDTGDFDGDGKADLLWQHPDGTYAMWLMDGSTQTGGARLRNAGSGWNVAHLGDFNADGRIDILWLHDDGSVEVALMDGAVTMPGSGALLGAGTGWSPKVVADFDGDIRSDIVWEHADGRAAIWLMNGAMQRGGGRLVGAGTGWSVKLAPDLDADGKADLVWAHADGTASAWMMNGAAQVGGARLLGPGTGWSPAFAGDFNGDAKLDILWIRADGAVATWHMDGPRQVGGARVLDPASGWTVRRLGDFSGDARADVVVQHVDGRVQLLEGSGTSFEAAVVLPSGTGWTVVPLREQR
jgi:glucose/arabinose dehydrogenase